MKVEGPGRSGSVSKNKGTKKAGGGEGRFGDFMTSPATENSAAAATQSIVSVDSLLALQAAEDPGQRAARSRMRRRGETILAALDKIRLGMLSGTLTVGNMIDIADVIASHREKITDPGLSAVMDEIDLRAQVELAKMRVALDKSISDIRS
jgi:hypothetical protein